MAKSARPVRKLKKTNNIVEQLEVPKKPGTQRHSALSGWPMILGWLAMLIFAFHASTHMVGAGDTWVAMACGRHFLNQGVDTVEPFSANSHKSGPTNESMTIYAKQLRDSLKTKPGEKKPGGFKTSMTKWWAGKVEQYPNWSEGTKRFVAVVHPTGWVNQNWLTHVIFYWLTHESPIADPDEFPPSFNQLVYWKIAIYIISVICVYYMGRIMGANAALSAVFACFAMFVGRSFFDVRPAGFSNMLVAVYLLILVLATYKNILYIWLIVPVVTFWCNLHGGYIYAFIMLVPFVGLNFLTSFSKKRFVSIGLKGIYHTIGAGFVAFVATIIFNPFHLTNLTHTFVISVSKHAEMWRTVNEWHPAFEWANPVGTSFPFLVLVVLSIGLTLLWLLSLLLKPRFLTAPINEMEAQKNLFTNLSRILGFATAVLVCWATLISFSLLNLSAADFIICAAFVSIIFLSIYKNVHFITLVIPLILLTMGFADPDWIKVFSRWFKSPDWLKYIPRGYNGRYIYPFILLPTYVTLHIIASLLSKKVKIKQHNIAFVLLAAIVTILLMAVIINPFGFKKPVWHVTQFLSLQRLLRPVYERNVEVSYRYLFSYLYFLNIISIIIWLLVPYLRTVFAQLKDNTNEEKAAEMYESPKIDLAMIAIAVLTTYMAVQSRRFIPIAAFAACPVVAMFIDQIIRTISATRNFHNRNTLTVSSMPQALQLCLIVAGLAAVLFSGIGWGLKFKRVYLDAWPTDTKLNSMFMRMTASDAKPFYACQFIKDNKLEGKLFNYWTEGGFIAYGQNPDPNTGRTPLRLFMDGRAQAAYQPAAYRMWSDIMSGGTTVYEARLRKRSLTRDDYIKIGKWANERLTGQKVWVVLMPTGQFETPFVKGLEHHNNWTIVFFNDKQKLFVDRTTPQGKKLFEGIFNGETLYSDEFTRNLIKAQHWFTMTQDKNARKQALEFAKEAFKLNQSQAPIRQILYATRFPELKTEAESFCKKYFDEFGANKDDWSHQDGYHHRIAAVLNVGSYFREVAKRAKNTELMQSYDTKMSQYHGERQALLRRKRW
ncbi:MAG: hypothetical protein ACYS32_10880 [Planctomycetota bacterium]|jgi:hypothetical protein